MNTIGIIAMTVVYLAGGFVGWMFQSFDATAPQIFWIIGAVTGISATLASQIGKPA